MNSGGSDLATVLQMLAGGACWLAVVALVSWVIGLLIFRPLNERTLLFKVDSNFRISDLLILAAHLQIAMGLVFMLTPGAPHYEKSMVAIWLCGLLGFWWVVGLRMLARGGVAYTWHRWLFLGVLVPVGYASALVLAISVVFVPISFVAMMQCLGDANMEGAFGAFAIIVLFAVVLGVASGCRFICRMIADRARDDRAKRDGIEFRDREVRERMSPPLIRPADAVAKSAVSNGVRVTDASSDGARQVKRGGSGDDFKHVRADVTFVD